MEKKMLYVAITPYKDGRFTGIINNRWHLSVSRSSAVRVIRLMKTADPRHVVINSSRWIYWWF